MPRMGRRDEALPREGGEVLEQELVARGIELARDIVEEKDRLVTVDPAEDRELRGLPREHDRAQLALRREGTGIAAVELEQEVVAVRADLGGAGREILGPTLGQVRQQL